VHRGEKLYLPLTVEGSEFFDRFWECPIFCV
jgi:hypothetical protein